MKPTKITVAYGDGIGPEIMEASLSILQAAGANLECEVIEIGEKIYQEGFTSGIKPKAWESLLETKVFYKAPITTPQGGGYKSLNVTIRKSLGMYANIRPTRSLSPYVKTKHPDLDLVIVRENEEDLYAGIEHRQTDEVYQCLKLISQPGTEKIVRYAFEYAVRNGRKKVTCFAKDNIMKLTDGLFHKVFDEVAKEYASVESEFWIVDIGAAKMADTPENFDVLVLPNLYGDILSDVAAQIAGSVGLAGSANIGDHCSMFEAIHGSAPRRAGQNMANPSGLLMGGIQMLVHIGKPEIASKVHNAWLKTMEDGVHTYDIFDEKISKKKVGTKEFAQAVIERLGSQPTRLKPVFYPQTHTKPISIQWQPAPAKKKELLGADVFVMERDRNPENLAKKLIEVQKNSGLELKMITNRGTKVWPDGMKETFCTDHWRCRFMSKQKNGPVEHQQIAGLLTAMAEMKIDFIKTENLCSFDGEMGFSKGQGE